VFLSRDFAKEDLVAIDARLVRTDIFLSRSLSALARRDVKERTVQRALDVLTVHEPLRQKGVRVRAEIFDGVQIVT